MTALVVIVNCMGLLLLKLKHGNEQKGWLKIENFFNISE